MISDLMKVLSYDKKLEMNAPDVTAVTCDV